MKSQILLFLIVLFLSVFETQAQPLGRPYRGFSLDNQCLSFEKDDVVFAGRIVSIVELSNRKGLPDVLKDIPEYNLKVKVSVGKVLNGKLSKKTIFFFTGSGGGADDLEVGEYRIFSVTDVTNMSKSFVSNGWSSFLLDNDRKENNSVFSEMETRLKEILISAISGKVVLRKDNSQEALLFFGMRIQNVNDRDLFTPIEGITVEAIRLKDGKSFRTQTDANGDYKLFDLEAGSYKIRLIAPEGFQEVKHQNENVIYKIQADGERDRCYRQVFLELKPIE